MKKTMTALILAPALICVLLCSCGSDKTTSGIASREQFIVGTADEFSPEYPNYNSSVSFSEVSAALNSETPQSSSAASESESNVSSKSASKVSSKSESTASSKSSSSVSSKASSTAVSGISSKVPSQAVQNPVSQSRINYRKMNAVWISYIDFAAILTGRSESEFRKNFETVCKNCVNSGINTLVCQVRPFGDAVYPSQYFAWSQTAAGIGKNPGYDPLAVMIEIAHGKKLSFQAWINPFRTYLNTQVSSVPTTSIFKKWYNDDSKRNNNLVRVNDRWYYNPGVPEVRQLVLDGVTEIIQNYKVDGIHFDDYFYPTTAKSFDAASYATYGGGKNLAQWRRDNVSSLVKSVYNSIKKVDTGIIFGISPQANLDNDMNSQYADVRLWSANNGYVDYLCPQIYSNYMSETADFASTLNTWNRLVTASGVKLCVGLAVYKIGLRYDMWACTSANRSVHNESTPGCGAFAWRTDNPQSSNILARQYADSMGASKCTGVFLYSYQHLFNSVTAFSNTESYMPYAATQAKAEAEKLFAAMK